MTIGDCFLMMGAKQEDPMTLYRIVNVRDNKIDALSVLIRKEQIMALDFPEEYDNDIPEEAVLLPHGTYDEVKQLIKNCATQFRKLIYENLIDVDFDIEVGKRYVDRFINTVTKIEKERIYYNVFRIEPENISPCWTGDECSDGIKERWRPITEEFYDELLHRYKIFVAHLQEYLFTLAKDS